MAVGMAAAMDRAAAAVTDAAAYAAAAMHSRLLEMLCLQCSVPGTHIHPQLPHTHLHTHLHT